MKTIKQLADIGAAAGLAQQLMIDGTTCTRLQADDTRDEPTRKAFAQAVLNAVMDDMPAWIDPSCGCERSPDCVGIPCPEHTPKPWTLPPPPKGRQWHRDDWTEEMLPEGWRPLLKGEIYQKDVDELLFFGSWVKVNHGGKPTDVAGDISYVRTRRPLPTPPDPYASLKAAHAAGKVVEYKPNARYGTWATLHLPCFNDPTYCYRIKPEPVLVPLTIDDIRATDEFKSKRGSAIYTPLFWDNINIKLTLGFANYQDLATNYLRRQHGSTEWKPCTKEATK